MKKTKIELEVENFLKTSKNDVEMLDKDEEKFYDKYKDLRPSYPDGEYKKMLMRYFHFWNKTSSVEELTMYPIYRKEMDILQKIWDDGEKKYEDAMRVCLMTCCMVYKKAHPHANGWIKYEPEKIVGGLYADWYIQDFLKTNSFAELIPYDFDMRVIGSKNPIVCYTVPTVDEEGDKGEPVCWAGLDSSGQVLRFVNEAGEVGSGVQL